MGSFSFSIISTHHKNVHGSTVSTLDSLDSDHTLDIVQSVNVRQAEWRGMVMRDMFLQSLDSDLAYLAYIPLWWGVIFDTEYVSGSLHNSNIITCDVKSLFRVIVVCIRAHEGAFGGSGTRSNHHRHHSNRKPRSRKR